MIEELKRATINGNALADVNNLIDKVNELVRLENSRSSAKIVRSPGGLSPQ